MIELSDEEYDRIWGEAEDAAINCVHIAQVINPYPEDNPRAEVWNAAFRRVYALEHGY